MGVVTGEVLLAMTKIKPGMPATIEAGQIWKDNDHRCPDRYLRVLEVTTGRRADVGHAKCERVIWNGVDAWVPVAGKKPLIALTRMRPTSNGYRLIQGAPPEPPRAA